MKTFYTAIAYAWYMASWRLWKLPGFMLRYYRYIGIEAEMEDLKLPEDERQVLREAWLHGDRLGYVRYPECVRCWTRYDPEHTVRGMKPVDGVCIPCQEASGDGDYLVCKKCDTFYAPSYEVLVPLEGVHPLFTSTDGVCASCKATEYMKENANA